MLNALLTSVNWSTAVNQNFIFDCVLPAQEPRPTMSTAVTIWAGPRAGTAQTRATRPCPSSGPTRQRSSTPRATARGGRPPCRRRAWWRGSSWSWSGGSWSGIPTPTPASLASSGPWSHTGRPIDVNLSYSALVISAFLLSLMSYVVWAL